MNSQINDRIGHTQLTSSRLECGDLWLVLSSASRGNVRREMMLSFFCHGCRFPQNGTPPYQPSHRLSTSHLVHSVSREMDNPDKSRTVL